MRLTLPSNIPDLAPWTRTLLRMLIDSGVYDIAYEDFAYARIGRRHNHFNLFRLDGTLFALDTWDYNSNLRNLGEHFIRDGTLKQVAAIIKIARRADDRYLTGFSRYVGKPVLPWTMFPDGLFPLGLFRYDNDCNHVYLGDLSGCLRRRGRKAWLAAAPRNDHYSPGFASRRMGYRVRDVRVPCAEYAEGLRLCRWGVALQGVGDKTRREVEFMSCGMPLALNYTPYYPFDFRPGVHYHLLRTPADLATLHYVDPRPYAAASAAAWERYFAPVAASRLLAEILMPFI